MRELSNRITEQWAFIKRTDKQNSKIAYFIHGFRGNYLQTWGKIPDMFSSNADSDSVFSDWDFVFLGYDTSKIYTYLDISSLLCTDITKAISGESPYKIKYEKFSLFGHSLGTLGIRQLLCAWAIQPTKMLSHLHKVTLFGTPINGSPLAFFAFGYPIKEALKPKSSQLKMLRIWLKSNFIFNPWPQARIILGQADKVVGYRYADLIDWPGDRIPVDITNLDHSELVKPTSWSNSVIIDYLREGLA